MRHGGPSRALAWLTAVLLAAWGPGAALGAEETEAGDDARPAEGREDEAPAGEKKGFWSRFKDPEDGKLDLTAGGEQGEGFLPLVVPFNDPAVGFGLTLALAYFHPAHGQPAVTKKGSAAPPTATFGAVAGTTNRSWFVVGGHHHVFRDDTIRYLGAVGGGPINLTFYGFGDQGTSDSGGKDFTLEILGTVQQVKFRVGDSPVFLGAKYAYAANEISFDTEIAGLVTGESSLAGLTALVEYDTRDTVFTPNRGLRATLDLSWYDQALGSDFDFGSAKTGLRYYWPVAESWVLGIRADYDVVGDEAPFYALSYVRLRGVPVFRYIGNYVATVELEPRYRIDDRWSVLAFAGAGRAATEASKLSDADRAYGLGVGFRYLLARKLGLAAGVDVAQGPEDTVTYLIVGSAW
jgi:hypothetical protein